MQRAVDEHPFWYHTMDIAPGVTTKGWFDLRPIVDQMPWPNVRGKRCLDIGTFDGYLAFELERRGASEVVAVDVEDHLLWDWPPDYREAGLARDPGFSRSEEHTSELQSLMRISYAVFCLKQKTTTTVDHTR